MKKIFILPLVILILLAIPSSAMANADKETFLVHLKTGLKKDDAQICVAYNIMWAALEEGYTVKVLIDADAINTFKIGWKGKDSIEGYKIPKNLRHALADQFKVELTAVPETYGDFLVMLNKKGVLFYINTGFLIVSKIGTPQNPMKKVSAPFFKPVTLREMIKIRTGATYYMAY